jgi:hypothetical protein
MAAPWQTQSRILKVANIAYENVMRQAPTPNLLTLLYLDAITHHPEFKLFEASFPAAFELSHPLAILGCVRHINNNLDQIIPIEHPAVAPVAFYFLRLITGSAKVIHNF